jgi:hypothetical protein
MFTEIDERVIIASDIAQGFITGVFPPVLLAILFLILPYLLKGLSPLNTSY